MIVAPWIPWAFYLGVYEVWGPAWWINWPIVLGC